MPGPFAPAIPAAARAPVRRAIRRRDLIPLCAAAAAWPLGARAERGPRRIGILVTGSPDSHGAFVAAFRRRLAELGHAEGRDVAFDLRWSEGRIERLGPLAEDLAQLAPDLVVTSTTAAALAAKRVMPERPIVSATLIDPIGAGLVTSLARPGGTVTGMLISFETLLGKQLEVAREMLPGVTRIGMLVNPANPVIPFQRENTQAYADRLRARLIPVEARSPADLDAAFATFARDSAGFVIVLLDALFITHRARIAELALASRVPTVAGARELAEAGGLVSYGIDLSATWRQAAAFADRVLRGARPADLPVELPTKYELVLNLGAASRFGITVSTMLLARADTVIE
ncbi:protein of unknown function DUF534 [Methylobacterium sp. 4-46]|uniref:ABC transporter substrate-binding protein n=1 Tax=unclassified Methylobacterium TaxID=2615210 RepID=UPI000152DDF5|nr:MULTISPECIES: ABC transporter substrate-binding protein [Methylobacterium]ACA15579.1 protein of unknown function DUF534 [Methylobacterium sp. 4-46]WFT81291.1 ABC transporter substrate-binding protein [Methylobacterium nodulans]